MTGGGHIILNIQHSKKGKTIETLIYLLNLYAEYICEMLGWMKHKLESRLLGEISIISDMQMTPSLWQKQRKTKEPLDESKRRE